MNILYHLVNRKQFSSMWIFVIDDIPLTGGAADASSLSLLSAELDSSFGGVLLAKVTCFNDQIINMKFKTNTYFPLPHL